MRGTRSRRLSVRDLREVIAQKERHRDQWLRGAHPPTGQLREAAERAGLQVHAIGVGRKIVEGVTTNTPCVRFYVTHKLPKPLLRAEDLIPDNLNGIPTDVIEAAVAYPAGSTAPPICSIEKLDRQRPICPGISTANAGVLAGTLGALCRSTVIGEETGRYILGCRHVLQGGQQDGASIYQPSPADGGTRNDEIAQFVRSMPFQQGLNANNTVDAAIALLADGIEATAEICRVGKLAGTGAASHGAVVHKHGRTSGYTIGQVDDPAIDVLVPESETAGAPPARFVGQFRVLPSAGMSMFAQTGDSGALVVERKSQNALGLLFACPRDNSFGYCNPIDKVLAALQITLEM